MAKIEKISDPLSDVLRNIQKADSFTAGWHRNIKKWRRRYNFDHYDNSAKPGEERYTDPTYTNTVDLAVGVLLSNEMIWRASGWKPSPEDTVSSSSAEKFVSAVIDINSDRKQVNMRYEAALNFARDGGAVTLNVWDTNYHTPEVADLPTPSGEIEQIQIFRQLPVRAEIIDPLQISVLPGGLGRWLMICRTEQMSVYDVENLYDVELERYKDRTTVEKIEEKGKFRDYWEWSYELLPSIPPDETESMEIQPPKKRWVVRNSLLFEDEFVRPLEIKEGYNDLPYTVALYKPTDRENSAMWHSILSPLENPVEELEKLTNERKRLLAMYSSMPLFVRTKDGRPVHLDPALGTAISLKEGEDAGFPKWEGTPPDFDKQMDMYRARIQQSGFSDVMYGSGPSAVSGYAVSQMNDQNRLRLVTPIEHLQDLWTWSAIKWLNMAKEFAAGSYISIYGHLRDKDFSEAVEVDTIADIGIRCEIRPEFPNDQVRKHAMATQAAPFLSKKNIVEDYLGYQQPDEVREMQMYEMAQDNPIAMQYAMMMYLKKMADAGDEIAAQVLAAQQAQMAQQLAGSTNQGGRPQEPSNPEQPMGLQSPNGQASPSATEFPGAEEIRGMQQQATAAPQMTGEVI